MDVELKEKLDETMELMHQITWWMIELQKKEIEGIKITKEQVLENKIINRLFGQVQNNYRELQVLIENKCKENKDDYIGNINGKTEDQMCNETIQMLENYLNQCYMKLKYVPFTGVMGMKKITSPSIYENTPYYKIIETEYVLQNLNLTQIENRIISNRSPERYSFLDKSTILYYIASNNFYKNYAFRELEKYEQKCNESINALASDVYDFQIEKITEQKYVQYYNYLNNKYNGFIQENDFGKFAKAKAIVDEGLEISAFNMTPFEIDSNIKITEDFLKINLKNAMNDFKIPFEKEKNAKNFKLLSDKINFNNDKEI